MTFTDVAQGIEVTLERFMDLEISYAEFEGIAHSINDDLYDLAHNNQDLEVLTDLSQYLDNTLENGLPTDLIGVLEEIGEEIFSMRSLDDVDFLQNSWES